MTHNHGYGFYFEKTGRGGFQGPNDVSGEYFTNTDIEQSIVREIIQNSLDARISDDSVVEVEFDLRSMQTEDIPDITSLRRAIGKSVEASKGLQGLARIQAAHESAQSQRIPVLRISDYGTTGLKGSESRDDPHSPLSILTRGTGVSSNEGSRGGSFGIGSAVGFVSSKMRTVAYTSRAVDKADEIVFAALSRLATHKDAEGVWRAGTGYYTSLEMTEDFRYQRLTEPFGDFPPRSDFGTDVYIFDYIRAGEDPQLHKIRSSVVSNFMVAIHRGRLVVRGRTDETKWVLDASTLPGVFDDDEELRDQVRPFYRALTESEPVVASIRQVGEVQLYVSVSDEYRPRMGTQVMRKPLMKVDVYHHNFHVPYAALFICEDPEGNALLRDIEPPTHDRWNTNGPRSNNRAVSTIKEFIRNVLKDKLPQHLGATTKIKGLEKYLPLTFGPADSFPPEASAGKTPSHRAPVVRESAARLGKSEATTVLDRKAGDKPSLIPVSRTGMAEDDGEYDASTGQTGGDGKVSDDPDRTRTAKGTEGDGVTRIRPGMVRMRSFMDARIQKTVVILHPEQDVDGDVEFVGLGGGSGDQFELELNGAQVEVGGVTYPMKTDGPWVRSLSLEHGKPVKLLLDFEGNQRYRIGVADG